MLNMEVNSSMRIEIILISILVILFSSCSKSNNDIAVAETEKGIESIYSTDNTETFLSEQIENITDDVKTTVESHSEDFADTSANIEIDTKDYQYLCSIGVIDTIKNSFTLDSFTNGINSAFSFSYSELITDSEGNQFQKLIIPTESNSQAAIERLINLFGELKYNDNGYYECPLTSLSEYYEIRSNLYTEEYLETQKSKASSDFKSLIEQDGALYFFNGVGYVNVPVIYETACIVSETEDELLIHFDYGSYENDISYSVKYNMKEIKDIWKIDSIEYLN